MINGQSDTVKHVIDAAVIPSGVIAATAHWMNLINGVMTFLVLVTSLVWGIYRIIDMHETRQARKNGVRK